ncbi:MAG TPA: hypothetical protein HA326_03810 [Thermoplasmata archaeon]|nr:hypothetical protein [Thermoplasmata archaeon]
MPFVYMEIVRSPDTYGVVILADKDRDPRLVAFGVIREELWRMHRSPRSAASGVEFFRYVETILEGEAERLASIVRDELAKASGHAVAWKELPAPLSSPASRSESASSRSV